MQKEIFICFFLPYATCLLTEETIRFVQDFFAYKHIRVASCVTCSKYDAVYITKSLMKTGKFWMASPHPEESPTDMIDRIMKRGYHKFGIFIDYDCPESKRFLSESSERKLMNSTFNWLIWSKEKFTSDVEYLNLNMDTEMTWAHPDDHLNRVIMYDLYKIGYTWPINATVAGHWSANEGIVYNLTEYKYSRRQDMRGFKLRAGLVVFNIPTDNLEVDLLKPENIVLDTMSTYNYRIFLMMKKFYNFTVQIVPTSHFGMETDDGRVEGMVKMLGNKEVDISITAMLYNTPRMDYCDSCPVSTWEFRMSALFRHPPVPGSYKTLLKPFEPSVWLGCGLMWFLMTVALRFISFFEAQYHVEENEVINPEIEGAWTWSDTLVIIMGALGQQGSTLDSRWITGRIVFLNTHILALMMNAYYSAFVVSSLLSAPTVTIRDTRGLIDSSLEFGAEDINYNRPYFELSTDPLIHELYVKKMAPPHKGYFFLDLGIQKVLNETFAFHSESINAYRIMEETYPDEAKCDLAEVEIFPIEKCYPFIPKSSPHKELFTYSYRRAVESGLINYMNLHWRPKKPPCTTKTDFRSVGIGTLLFGIWLLAGGIFMSVLIIILEVTVKRFYWMKRNAMHFNPTIRVSPASKDDASDYPMIGNVTREELKLPSSEGDTFTYRKKMPINTEK